MTGSVDGAGLLSWLPLLDVDGLRETGGGAGVGVGALLGGCSGGGLLASKLPKLSRKVGREGCCVVF